MKRVIRTTGEPPGPYPQTTAGDTVITYENGASHKISRSPAAELTDTHRRLLTTIHFDLLVQEVERRGWRVCMNSACGLGVPAVFPPEIYRRRLTNVFYTADGQVFCNTLDPVSRQYRYDATTADAHGDVEVWRRVRVATDEDLPFDGEDRRP